MAADKTKKRITRVVSLLTLSFFLFSQVTLANSGVGIKIAVKREMPGFLRIDIPTELASLDEIYEAPPSPDPKLILHIQNAHANYDAQQKIKELLAHLNKTYGIGTIFVEGASERLDPDYLKFFPDQERNQKLADLLAREGELTGAELYLIGADNKKIEAEGIEDAGLYRANYEALKKVFGSETVVNKYVNGLESRLETISFKISDPDMRRMLSEWKKFEKGRREFMPYLRSLSEDAKRVLKLDLESLFSQVEWPQVTRLLVLQQMEKEMNLDRALAEKAKLVEFLKGKRLSIDLIQAIENFKDQHISVSRKGKGGATEAVQPRYLLERLAQEAGPQGFQFSDYPDFSLYAGYLILKSEVDSRGLFAEINRLFREILDQLAVTENQKELLALTRDAELVRKLLSLELTRVDWKEADAKKAELALDPLIERLKALEKSVNAEFKLADTNFETKTVSGKFRSNVTDVYEAAYSFYDYARKRESVFYEKMSAVMADKARNKAILITGGFHTDGVSDILRENEISYGILTPRLMEKSDERLYRTVMLQNREHPFNVSYIEQVVNAMPLIAQNAQGANITEKIATALDGVMSVGNQTLPEAIVTVNKSSFAARNELRLAETGKDPNDRPLIRVLKPSEVTPGVTTPIDNLLITTGRLHQLAVPAGADIQVAPEARSEVRYQVKTLYSELLTGNISMELFKRVLTTMINDFSEISQKQEVYATVFPASERDAVAEIKEKLKAFIPELPDEVAVKKDAAALAKKYHAELVKIQKEFKKYSESSLETIEYRMKEYMQSHPKSQPVEKDAIFQMMGNQMVLKYGGSATQSLYWYVWRQKGTNVDEAGKPILENGKFYIVRLKFKKDKYGKEEYSGRGNPHEIPQNGTPLKMKALVDQAGAKGPAYFADEKTEKQYLDAGFKVGDEGFTVQIGTFITAEALKGKDKKKYDPFRHPFIAKVKVEGKEAVTITGIEAAPKMFDILGAILSNKKVMQLWSADAQFDRNMELRGLQERAAELSQISATQDALTGQGKGASDEMKGVWELLSGGSAPAKSERDTIERIASKTPLELQGIHARIRENIAKDSAKRPYRQAEAVLREGYFADAKADPTLIPPAQVLETISMLKPYLSLEHLIGDTNRSEVRVGVDEVLNLATELAAEHVRGHSENIGRLSGELKNSIEDLLPGSAVEVSGGIRITPARAKMKTFDVNKMTEAEYREEIARLGQWLSDQISRSEMRNLTVMGAAVLYPLTSVSDVSKNLQDPMINGGLSIQLDETASNVNVLAKGQKVMSVDAGSVLGIRDIGGDVIVGFKLKEEEEPQFVLVHAGVDPSQVSMIQDGKNMIPKNLILRNPDAYFEAIGFFAERDEISSRSETRVTPLVVPQRIIFKNSFEVRIPDAVFQSMLEAKRNSVALIENTDVIRRRTLVPTVDKVSVRGVPSLQISVVAFEAADGKAYVHFYTAAGSAVRRNLITFPITSQSSVWVNPSAENVQTAEYQGRPIFDGQHFGVTVGTSDGYQAKLLFTEGGAIDFAGTNSSKGPVSFLTGPQGASLKYWDLAQPDYSLGALLFPQSVSTRPAAMPTPVAKPAAAAIAPEAQSQSLEMTPIERSNFEKLNRWIQSWFDRKLPLSDSIFLQAYRAVIKKKSSAEENPDERAFQRILGVLQDNRAKNSDPNDVVAEIARAETRVTSEQQIVAEQLEQALAPDKLETLMATTSAVLRAMKIDESKLGTPALKVAVVLTQGILGKTKDRAVTVTLLEQIAGLVDGATYKGIVRQLSVAVPGAKVAVSVAPCVVGEVVGSIGNVDDFVETLKFNWLTNPEADYVYLSLAGKADEAAIQEVESRIEAWSQKIHAPALVRKLEFSGNAKAFQKAVAKKAGQKNYILAAAVDVLAQSGLDPTMITKGAFIVKSFDEKDPALLIAARNVLTKKAQAIHGVPVEKIGEVLEQSLKDGGIEKNAKNGYSITEASLQSVFANLKTLFEAFKTIAKAA